MPRQAVVRRALLALALLLAGALLWVGTPRILGRLGFFRVQRVEFVGLRHHDQHHLARVMALEPGASVFDDLEPAAARLRMVPGVLDVRVGRRLPGTVRVRLVEQRPVALAPSEGRLVPIDELGRPLPYDPTDGAPDLPVARAVDSLVAAGLARIRALDPDAWDEIATAERANGHLLLQVGEHRWRLPADVSAEALRAVQVVAEALAREGRRYRELDGRFARQVVVRGLTS